MPTMLERNAGTHRRQPAGFGDLTDAPSATPIRPASPTLANPSSSPLVLPHKIWRPAPTTVSASQVQAPAAPVPRPALTPASLAAAGLTYTDMTFLRTFGTLCVCAHP